MRQLGTVLLALMLLSGLAAGQWVQTGGPSGAEVKALATNPTNGSVFALAGGDAYRSTDAGATWASVTNGLQANMGATLVAASGTTVYLGLTSGNTPNILFRSTDNGDTWTVPAATGIPSLYLPGAMLIVGSKVFMYGAYLLGGGKIFASTDAGENWGESTAGLPANFVVAYFATKGGDIYAGSSPVSATKGVYKSTDNGASWTATGLPSTYTVNGLTANTSAVFASTNTSGVYRSTDNGTTWTKINPDTPTNFATTVLATSSNLFIGEGGYVFRANQNGDSWDSAKVGLPPANAGTAITVMAASGTSILCGFSKHGIYRTTDNGTNWVQSHPGLKASKIDGIHESNGVLFAAGDQYGYFRSTDQGGTWTEVNTGVAAAAGWFCFARVGSDMLAGAGSSLLYRSSDNGTTWTLSNTGFGLTNSFAFAVDGNTVYTTGLPGVAKSTDGGLNWTTLSSGFLFYETGTDIWKDGSNLVVCTNLSRHRSTDDGATWTAPIGGFAGGYATSSFSQVGATLLAGHGPFVYQSTDHGATWTSIGNLGIAVTSLAVSGTDIFAGTTDGVFRSSDGGGTWAAINDGFAPKTYVNKMAVDNQYLYAGTLNRSVWRRPLSQISTGVHELANGLPAGFALRQNFPNPFNPSTTVEFQISERGSVTLSVYDLLGREVATLVNEELHPGTYHATWDASGISSGIYYIRLQSGSLAEMKKMMLMK